VPDANGKFQNAGILEARGNTFDVDVSKGTVVAASEDQFGIVELAVFELPSPLMPPKGIVNDFNTRDVSGFQTTPSGAYTVVGSGSQWFYRQPTTSGATTAVVSGSDWSFYQSIDVRIQPGGLTLPGQWVGAALRYIDADNFYFVKISYDRLSINRRLNGVNTELNSTPLNGALLTGTRFHDVHFHIRRSPCTECVGGSEELYATLDVGFFIFGTDNSLSHGSAALLTHEARADFDNLYVSPSNRYGLLFMNFLDKPGRPLETRGGTWTEENTGPYGVRQSDTSVLATAVGGAPIDDQRVRADVRLESFGSVSPVPWFGLLARYRDPMNYYSLSVRGSGQLQNRKLVNGVMTVLAAKPFTVNPGDYHVYELHAFGDQLQATVDRVVIATAQDSDLPLGRHGVATYRTSAFFHSIIVDQP
jgi:hypothetical protein